MVEYSHWRFDLVPELENEDSRIPDLLYALIVEKCRAWVVSAGEALAVVAADAGVKLQGQRDRDTNHRSAHPQKPCAQVQLPGGDSRIGAFPNQRRRERSMKAV